MVEIASPEILGFAAWPSQILYRDGKASGLLMRKISGLNRPVHELYSPKTRVREFPSANWQFLVHVATNVARGFAVIHKIGHVVGDVNHGNILVGANGTSAFIDCDSFQIHSNGRVFMCEVGVSTYTPPELQNKSFNQVVRTTNHDAFGLAVLIFHLLFMGRHPFAGRYAGSGDMPIERAIAECRFPFGRLAANMQMSPPPNSLLLSQIPTRMADAFERAFCSASTKINSRPNALEWISCLQELQQSTLKCRVNGAHVYFSQLGSCPWCEIEIRSGSILFVDVAVVLSTGLKIDELWHRLSALQPLGELPAIPTRQNRSMQSNPQLRGQGRHRRIRVVGGIAVVVLTIFVVVLVNLNGIRALLLISAAIISALKLPIELQRKRSALWRIVRERQSKFQELQNRYAFECNSEGFADRCKELEKARTEYNNLPLLRRQKIQELEKNKRDIQLRDYLDAFDLGGATISGIGPGRKAMLSSYGIDSAADISWQSVTQVPGIGPKFGGKLLSWRQSIENRFRFDPSKAISKLEVDKIDREIQKKQAELEQSLSRGIADAVTFHAKISASRKNYLEQMESAIKDLIQAELDHKAS